MHGYWFLCVHPVLSCHTHILWKHKTYTNHSKAKHTLLYVQRVGKRCRIIHKKNTAKTCQCKSHKRKHNCRNKIRIRAALKLTILSHKIRKHPHSKRYSKNKKKKTHSPRDCACWMTFTPGVVSTNNQNHDANKKKHKVAKCIAC